jgi:hypothetical protein
MPGWYPQRRGTARTLSNFCVALCIFCVLLRSFCVVLCIVCFVTFSVLFVCICVLNNYHRVATQLQLNISYHSIRIFRLKRDIIRIILGCKSRETCRNLFKELKILPLPSQYVYSLLLFVINKKRFKAWTLDNIVIFTESSLVWKNTKNIFISLALRSSIIFHHTLRLCLILLSNLN